MRFNPSKVVQFASADVFYVRIVTATTRAALRRTFTMGTLKWRHKAALRSFYFSLFFLLDKKVIALLTWDWDYGSVRSTFSMLVESEPWRAPAPSDIGTRSYPNSTDPLWRHIEVTWSLRVPWKSKIKQSKSQQTIIVKQRENSWEIRKPTQRFRLQLIYKRTMYIGEPQSVAAMTPSWRNRANPKSAIQR